MTVISLMAAGILAAVAVVAVAARACPIESRLPITSSRTEEGSLRRRSELVTVLRSLPTRSARDSCV